MESLEFGDIDKYRDDFELFISNDRAVRKFFKVDIKWLINEYNMFFEYANKRNRTGIKLKLSNDKADNDLVWSRAFDILIEFYDPYYLTQKELKKMKGMNSRRYGRIIKVIKAGDDGDEFKKSED